MEKTLTETLLDYSGWYTDPTGIKRLTDQCDKDFGAFTHLHTGDINIQAKQRAAVVIEMAAREFRKNPRLSVFDLMLSPFFDKMLTFSQQREKDTRISNLTVDTIRNLSQLAAVGAHVASGLQVYEVTDGLLERLKMTSTEDLSIEDVKFPYPSTWFQFPKGAIRTRGIDLTLMDVVGCMIREVDRGPTKARVVELTVTATEAFSEYMPFILYSVELPFHAKWEDMLSNMEMFTMKRDTNNEAYFSFEAFLPTLWDLLVNLLMYATHPDAANILELWNPDYTRLKEQVSKHPKGSHKRDRAKEQLRHTPPQHRIVLGRGVTPLPPLPPSEKGAPLALRTLVQGHWQRYAIGKGRTDRTWKFRSPFWRGPEGAPESRPRHTMV
jgi:hypothetical protein